MTKKTIQFNPNYFTLSGKKTLSKKEKKRNVSLANPNKIKKQLIMKIKEYQKKENKKQNKEYTSGGTIISDNKNNDTTDEVESDDDIKNFEDEFNKSLNFLQELSNKNSKQQNQHQQNQQQRQPKNTSLKPKKFLSNNNVQDSINIDYPYDEISQSSANIIRVSPSVKNNNTESILTQDTTYTININSSKLKTDPPYSILKNGSKPTYRQWIRETQKVHSHHHNGGSHKHKPIIIENNPENNPENNNSVDTPAGHPLTPEVIGDIASYKIPERSKELSRIKKHLHNTVHNSNKSTHNIRDTTTNANKQSNTIKAKKITKTIKRKLGKSGRKISILIKNRETRKKIQTEKALLNRKNIAEVKQYLRDHNLIKTGTTAPNHVLRNLYENSILSGEINNKSSNVLLHNFINN